MTTQVTPTIARLDERLMVWARARGTAFSLEAVRRWARNLEVYGRPLTQALQRLVAQNQLVTFVHSVSGETRWRLPKSGDGDEEAIVPFTAPPPEELPASTAPTPLPSVPEPSPNLPPEASCVPAASAPTVLLPTPPLPCLEPSSAPEAPPHLAPSAEPEESYDDEEEEEETRGLFSVSAPLPEVTHEQLEAASPPIAPPTLPTPRRWAPLQGARNASEEELLRILGDGQPHRWSELTVTRHHARGLRRLTDVGVVRNEGGIYRLASPPAPTSDAAEVPAPASVPAVSVAALAEARQAPKASPRSSERIWRIVAALSETEDRKPGDLAQLLDIPSDRVSQALLRLESDGTAYRVRYGTWRKFPLLQRFARVRLQQPLLSDAELAQRLYVPLDALKEVLEQLSPSGNTSSS